MLGCQLEMPRRGVQVERTVDPLENWQQVSGDLTVLPFLSASETLVAGSLLVLEEFVTFC